MPLSMTIRIGLPRFCRSLSNTRTTRSAATRCRPRSPASPRIRILNRQRAYLAAGGQCILMEIHGPCLVLPHGRCQQHSRLGADPPSPLASAYHQLLFRVDLGDPFAVHRPAFPLQQNMQPPISPATSIFGQLAHANAQTIVGFGKARLPPTVPQHSP